MQDYSGSLEVLMLISLILMGLRFAFPKLRFALGAAMVLVLAIAAFIPGVRMWFSAVALAAAAITAVALGRIWRARGHDDTAHLEQS